MEEKEAFGEESRRSPAAPAAGVVVFAPVFLLFSLFLLAQIPAESAWVKNTGWYAQPRFWPSVSIIGMALFAAGYCAANFRRDGGGERKELLLWLGALEYAAYFFAYVIVTPLAGYLPATVLFATALAARVGHGSIRMLAFAAGFAVVVVVVFRAVLGVKIPPGKMYEFLPETVRVFFLTYL